MKLRWRQHKTDLNNNRHHSIYLQRSWNKYGANAFYLLILEIVQDEEKLLEREQMHMDVKCDYNMCKIASSGTCDWSIPVCQYDLDMNLIDEYSSINEAARKTGIDVNVIRACVHSLKDARKPDIYLWSKKGEKPVKRKIAKQGRPVNQYTVDGKFIRRFDSASEASRITKESINLILRDCHFYNEEKDVEPGKWSNQVFYWKFAKEKNKSTPKKHSKKVRSVCQYSLDGKFLQKFSSIRKATKNVGLRDSAGICRCCNFNAGKNMKKPALSAAGYRWAFEGDKLKVKNKESNLGS